ncbi:hypothetical protein ACSVIJ_18200, partial [Pseudomonas sp. NCHU5208]
QTARLMQASSSYPIDQNGIFVGIPQARMPLVKRTVISDHCRWQTVATDIRTKTRVEDLSALLAAYELYIVRGEVDLSRGQISPVKLAGQDAGSK